MMSCKESAIHILPYKCLIFLKNYKIYFMHIIKVLTGCGLPMLFLGNSVLFCNGSTFLLRTALQYTCKLIKLNLVSSINPKYWNTWAKLFKTWLA